MHRAIGHYHEALRLEPNFALAHLGLGRVWGILPSHGAALAAEAYPRAKHHAAKALTLDPSLGEAHAWFAMALVCYEWDWAGAEREFERAIESDPTATICRVTRALYLLAPLGRFDEAIAEVELARALEPTSLAANAYVAMTYYYVHQYEWAAREARMTLELNAEFPLAWWVLGMASEQIGQMEEAVEAFQRAIVLTRGSSLMPAHLARVFARMGNREHAEAILDQITGSAEVADPLAVFIAAIHVALEDSDTALNWLYRAYRTRAPHLLRAKINPVFESLKNERRFRELLLRIGLGAT
jgi:tetratricopeptide (TPR) repeat protein